MDKTSHRLPKYNVLTANPCRPFILGAGIELTPENSGLEPPGQFQQNHTQHQQPAHTLQTPTRKGFSMKIGVGTPKITSTHA